jgi:hypothetical protein
MTELVKILNNPEEHYPGNFDTPQRANALLTGLCQDAANEIAKLQYEVDAIPAIKEERDALAAELTRLKASIALDKMAENARELGLSYEPALMQQPVAWVDLLKKAEEVVRSKPLWKKYIDGTPLANDIAVWMASFAQAHTTPPAPQPVPVKTYFDGKPWPVAPKPWVGLTDEDIEQGWKESWVNKQAFESAVWWAEKKLKEKNHDQ